MDTVDGATDSYSYHLALLGHQVHNVMANPAPLQKVWVHAFVQWEGHHQCVSSGRRYRELDGGVIWPP
jgi:hypothetical protein